MNTNTRIKQALSVAFIGCAIATSASAKCGVMHPGGCVTTVSNAASSAVTTVTHTAAENTAAVTHGFTDATQEAASLASAGYTATSTAYSKYTNAAEIAAYNTLAQAQGYANLAAADTQAGVYGGYHTVKYGTTSFAVANYSSLKARLIAESMPIIAADVAKFQGAYAKTVAAGKVAYNAASPYLKLAISDGTTLESLIVKSCKSGGQSSVAAEQRAMAPFIALVKSADPEDLEAINRILRALFSGKTPDQSLAHDLRQLGTDIGIIKAIGSSAGPSDYKGSTWGLSVSVSGGWIGDGSVSAAFNMNTEPFVSTVNVPQIKILNKTIPAHTVNNYYYGYSISTNDGVSFELGTNDVEPGVTVGFGVSLGAGDSTAANQGVSFSLGMAAGAGLQFSSDLGWVFPLPTMNNLNSLFGAFKTAEQALVASTKKGVSGKDMLNAGYKVGSQTVDAALGPLVSTIGTLCSLPGITVGMGINFSPSVASANLSVTPGISAVLWSGTI